MAITQPEETTPFIFAHPVGAQRGRRRPLLALEPRLWMWPAQACEDMQMGQANSIDAVTGDTSKTERSATPAAASAAATEMPANGMSRCEDKVSLCRASATAAPAPSTSTREWVTQPCGGCARAVCAVAAAEENSRS
jgi:hypothetical protein